MIYLKWTLDPESWFEIYFDEKMGFQYVRKILVMVRFVT